MSQTTTPSASAEKSGTANRRILYCNCAYARVVPADTKSAVLAGLSGADVAFDAVPDLCELAARRDKSLERLAAGSQPVDVVACFPRAVRWLFHAADAPLPEDGVRILNMREEQPDSILATVLGTAPEDTVESAPNNAADTATEEATP